ncbi:hypothetical protein HBI25_030580 [Parastagonospora nodorum]|nr:hypothetical protein HBH43_125110 [Parastagonospora nodorum]KAH4334694.1 hypothetical protein HBI00_029640 [Parastagonospora nodorum]KAH4417264.1 hypothetical protein HBH92_064670 [Parastagonospora nodorum]KAH4454241.1 hypothetical protein HBH90_175180 [Parastagonospora nodorum]KAH4457862.1 hypothetical protein HBH91_082990 [Parastagonospora nodorum]
MATHALPLERWENRKARIRTGLIPICSQSKHLLAQTRSVEALLEAWVRGMVAQHTPIVAYFNGQRKR